MSDNKPSPSSSSKDSSPAKFNNITKQKKFTGKSKDSSGEEMRSKSVSGTKRSYEEDHDDYQNTSTTPSENSAPNTHDFKRSAYDVGTSKPHYTNGPQRYGPGLQERKPTPFLAQQTQEDYSVPNHMVGLLIGKGGENLKKIERISGVSKVQFDNDPIGNERVVHIIGESDQIAIARDMIRQMVSDAQVNDSNRFQAQGGQTTVNFRIPSNKVGLVIGRGGETLKDFQERSKAKIMIASDSYGDRNHERVITLVGDENSTQQARKLIEELIFGSTNPPATVVHPPPFDPNQYNTAYNFYGYGAVPRPDDDNALVPVPSYAVGLIIGKGGETIRSIQDQSGARVKVNPTNDPSPEQRIVNISGDPNCVAFARRLVEDKVNEANRSRNPGQVVPPPPQFYAAEYNQYHQYYAQYGHNPQYYPPNAPGYPQYPNHPYPYPSGPNGNIPAHPTHPQGPNKNVSPPVDYYNNQFYGGQQSAADQQAYYQWYQQYYNPQQQYTNYPPPQHHQAPAPPANNSNRSKHGNSNRKGEVKTEAQRKNKSGAAGNKSAV